MKNMNKIRALVLLSAMLATAQLAKAQQLLQAGQTYVFTGTAASGVGAITYQWYRNNEPIADAADTSYTLPGSLAFGENVEIKRGAVSSACPHSVSYTNRFIITFCSGCPIGNTCWAETNVTQPGKFAAKPDMYTEFYQRYCLKAWSATASTVSGWGASCTSSETWNPCPAGWRLPTDEEFVALINPGSTWAAANSARGNAVAGRFFGPNHSNSASCTLPSSMISCIFLPANGVRNYTNGNLADQGSYGWYWGSYQLAFYNYDGSISVNNDPRYSGLSVRCVQ